MTRDIKALLAATLLSIVLAACGAPPAGNSTKTLQVIAGENFWGSIAAQLGGARVEVTSIVTNPNTDPHEYESSATDARAFATADYVILNGAGYDDWGQKLLSANPSSSRKVFTVADLLNKKAGDNPHFWYNPDWVEPTGSPPTTRRSIPRTRPISASSARPSETRSSRTMTRSRGFDPASLASRSARPRASSSTWRRRWAST
jgi:hypothetical protein